ncbi:hypothetical protein [Methylobrevis pamukkalensis]|uniref:hypothetical protein n=1 Tax=Methylobrevis pamukkalensis TaxID=1439726 RepID=UPI000845DC58|nr:hypothetical protein [Methylobrevis pamukkalensis]
MGDTAQRVADRTGIRHVEPHRQMRRLAQRRERVLDHRHDSMVGMQVDEAAGKVPADGFGEAHGVLLDAQALAVEHGQQRLGGGGKRPASSASRPTAFASVSSRPSRRPRSSAARSASASIA